MTARSQDETTEVIAAAIALVEGADAVCGHEHYGVLSTLADYQRLRAALRRLTGVDHGRDLARLCGEPLPGRDPEVLAESARELGE